MAKVDDHGNIHLLIDKIEDHQINKEAILMNQGTYNTKSGFDREIRTTKEWEFYVIWKDRYRDWINMKDLKDSYPVPLVDYSVANKIQDEPAFSWWFPYTLKKRIAIISKIKSKFWNKTHKYGIKTPRNVKEAKAIDIEN